MNHRRMATLCLVAALLCIANNGWTGTVIEHSTPFYHITLEDDPVRIIDLRWDPEGKRAYRALAYASMPNTPWASTLFAGREAFTDTLAGTAARVVYDREAGSLLLEGIQLLPGIKGDWRFHFKDQEFTHEITWHIGADAPPVKNLGHQWLMPLGASGDAETMNRTGDTPGFGDTAFIYDEETAFRMAFEAGSTTMHDVRFFHPAGLVWQNVFAPETRQLEPGSYPGGTWVCGALPAAKANVPAATNHIGQFRRDGFYMKDYFCLKDGDTYHLFYNIGAANMTQDWMEPGNEERFGHSTSKDLRHWEHHPDVMHKVPGGWEGKTVSAPSIVKEGDTWHMIYTGFDDRALGCQRIGVAHSKDLFEWERNPNNPVYVGPDWTNWKAGQWADCRDAHVMPHDGQYYMYTMVTTKEGQGAIAIARSDDLVNWEDLGPACVPGGAPESPITFERNGKFYLITTGSAQGLFMSNGPAANDWEQLPWEMPPRGFWSAYEVMREDDGRYIISCFEWRMMGNHIRFWELAWDGDRPYVKY